jgi:hypothetical protein
MIKFAVNRVDLNLLRKDGAKGEQTRNQNLEIILDTFRTGYETIRSVESRSYFKIGSTAQASRIDHWFLSMAWNLTGLNWIFPFNESLAS